MPQTFPPSRPALAQALLPSHWRGFLKIRAPFCEPRKTELRFGGIKREPTAKLRGPVWGPMIRITMLPGKEVGRLCLEMASVPLFLGQCSWVPYACDVNIPWVNALIGNLNQTTSDLPEHKEGQDSPSFPYSVWSSWLGLPGIPGESLQCFVGCLHDPVGNRTGNPFLGSSLINL